MMPRNRNNIPVAIELDGKWHSEEQVQEYDAKRSKYLESLGFVVLRFDNVDIHMNFDNVCNLISDTVEARLRQL